MATIGDLEVTDRVELHPAVLPAAAEFASFYRQHYQGVLRTALALTQDLRAAEDLTQDAFVAAQRNWARISRYDRPDLWVRRVLTNLSTSRFRRLTREARALTRLAGRAAPTLEVPLPDPELWDALARLPRRQAQVVVLAVIEDRPTADVAHILGCGPETVRTHLRRARNRLADLLSEEHR